ncbi:MAG: S1 family peptidase [Acidimicrobiia bacterium]
MSADAAIDRGQGSGVVMVITGTSRSGRLARCVLVLVTALGASVATAVRAGADPAPDPGVTGYIVGGAPVDAGAYPSLVAILIDAPGIPARNRLVCTGTVVTSRWVLTAGHCSIEVLFGSPLLVQVGSRDLGGRGAQTVRVNRATVHKTFFNRGIAYDVALLHTNTALNAPASRLATAADAALEAGGLRATAVGWGLTKQLGIEELPGPRATQPRRARAVEIPIVDDATCAATFADLTPGYFVPASDLCAGEAGRNVCYGDSGGPLYATDPQGAFVQIGITSRGAGCATKLFPAIFTDVRRANPWIQRWSTHACPNRVTIPVDPGFPDEPAPNGPLYAC